VIPLATQNTIKAVRKRKRRRRKKRKRLYSCRICGFLHDTKQDAELCEETCLCKIELENLKGGN